MSTSGTVSQTIFKTRKVIDHAARRCRLTPQQLAGENLQVALDLLFTRLSSLANQGIPLWCIQKLLQPIYTGQQTVTMPDGVVDVLNVNLRTVQRLTDADTGTPGVATASEGIADNAFDGDLSTACTQTTPNGWIEFTFDSATLACNFGILPNASGTWSYALQGSDDGVSFQTFYSVTDQDIVEGEWQWFDVEGMADWSVIRLQASGGTILDVTELVYANTPNAIPLALINRDDYSSLPNKFFKSRPTEYWLDKQVPDVKLKLWPSPQEQFTFAQLECFVQMYIQDVGTMAQELQIPQRWFEAVIDQLAFDLGKELKEVDANLVPMLEQRAMSSMRDAWGGESDRAPTYIRPNIRPYTA